MTQTRVIQLGNIAPKHYKTAHLGDQPQLLEEQPELDTVTEIHVSPDSTTAQALTEIQTVWDIHSHNDAPEWIGHTADLALLAQLLAEHFGVTDIRSLS